MHKDKQLAQWVYGYPKQGIILELASQDIVENTLFSSV